MGKKSVQTFNCFGVLDSVCQFGACLAAWLRRKHQKKSQMCQLGLTSLEFQNRFFFTELWYETIDFYGHWISVHWFMVFLGNFCHGIELWGEYWQNLVAILVVAAPYLSQPPTKNEGNKSTYPDIKANRWKHTKSMEEKNRLQHVEKLSPFFFSAVFKGLGCWTCRQWFSWYKKLRLSIHIIVKAGDFGSRDHGGCAPGDSMIDTAALCGKGRIWS